MLTTTRRSFLKHTASTGLAFGLPGLLLGRSGRAAAAGPNSEIRLAVVGLGGIKTPGGVGGRGRQLIARFSKVPGVRIAALCDVDREVLDHELQPFQERGEKPTAYEDVRKLLDDRGIDAVVLATPNHWHALGTIWACQAGKDVYVEKPFSYNIWEGRQMVAAARKYGRIVQHGTQRRSSDLLRQAFQELQKGELGPIRCARAMVNRRRDGIGRQEQPTPIPSTVNYDLWCGPAPKSPPMRTQFHYEWHWFWAYGNGEIGNNGTHMIDVCRLALGQEDVPPRVLSIGGRFGFDDSAETANTQIVLLDYRPAPLLCEIRNFSKSKESMGKFRTGARGVMIDCEGGYFAGDMSEGTFFDYQGRKIKDLPRGPKPQEVELQHGTNFIEAVRSRKADQLRADARVGCVSAACCHMANVSYRLGRQAPPEAILEASRGRPELTDAVERCRDYLKDNDIDLERTRAVLGPWVDFDARREEFTGPRAAEANALSRRAYREPFVVPAIT